MPIANRSHRSGIMLLRLMQSKVPALFFVAYGKFDKFLAHDKANITYSRFCNTAVLISNRVLLSHNSTFIVTFTILELIQVS